MDEKAEGLKDILLSKRNCTRKVLGTGLRTEHMGKRKTNGDQCGWDSSEGGQGTRSTEAEAGTCAPEAGGSLPTSLTELLCPRGQPLGLAPAGGWHTGQD